MTSYTLKSSVKSTCKKSMKNKNGMDYNNIISRTKKFTLLFRKQITVGKSDAVPQIYKNKYLPDTIPVKPYDNKDYSWYKYTIVPAGSTFLFRSMNRIDRIDNTRKAIWLDYSESLGSPSFERNDVNLSRGVYNGIVNRFGEWLNTIVILKDMKILHFPVDYENTGKNDIHSYTSELESIVRSTCVNDPDIYDPYGICIDGYTLDFLWRSPGNEESLPLPGIEYYLKGYRELCILLSKNKKNIRLISSIKK